MMDTLYDLACLMIYKFFDKKLSIVSSTGTYYKSSTDDFIVNINNPYKFIYNVVTRGELGFGESYSYNYWNLSKGDIGRFMYYCGINFADEKGDTLACKIKKYLPFEWFRRYNFKWGNTHNIESAEQIIKEAYDDVDPILYDVMLDKTYKQYTSAIYETDDSTLDEAQKLKLETLMTKSNLKSNNRILDIGCGWGGLLEYATSSRENVEGIGITNSDKMYQGTLNRANTTKLPFSALKCDFRDIPSDIGQFDAILNVEMLEAIGVDLFDDFAKVCYKFCKQDGKVVIQVINVSHDVPDEKQVHDCFTLTYIFPGSQCPHINQLTRVLERYFEIESIESIGNSYVKTLRDWRINLMNGKDKLSHIDPSIIRGFEYYLSWCEAGFDIGILDVSQLILSPL